MVNRPQFVVISSPIVRLFASRTLVEVLSLLFLHPEEEFYQRDVAERTGRALTLVQRALKRIEQAGLVRRTRRGNRIYYRAERMHPAFEDLKRAFLKTVALGDALRSAFEPLSSKVRLAFVYGSLARGEETAQSDIDLLIVGDVSGREVTKILGPAARELDRELNPAVYPPDEFREKAKQGHHFIKEVMEGPKIWLTGTDDELARLVEVTLPTPPEGTVLSRAGPLGALSEIDVSLRGVLHPGSIVAGGSNDPESEESYGRSTRDRLLRD